VTHDALWSCNYGKPNRHQNVIKDDDEWDVKDNNSIAVGPGTLRFLLSRGRTKSGI